MIPKTEVAQKGLKNLPLALHGVGGTEEEEMEEEEDEDDKVLYL